MGAAAVVVREAAALLGTLAAGGDDYAGRGPDAGGLLAAAAAAAPEPGSAPMAALDDIGAALDWALPVPKARMPLPPARTFRLPALRSCLQHACAAAATPGLGSTLFNVIADNDVVVFHVAQICQPGFAPLSRTRVLSLKLRSQWAVPPVSGPPPRRIRPFPA